MDDVRLIVLTGGPCAGKTTAMPRVKKELERIGYTVGVVPEVAGLLLAHGYQLREAAANKDQAAYMRMQIEICRVQLALEDAMRISLEAMRKPGVVLCDRGLLDNQAYVFPEQWKKILAQFGKNPERDWMKRYYRVYHLVSAADGAEEHYKAEGVRSENLEVARVLEERTLDGWYQHPGLRIFPNAEDGFEGKLHRLLQSVARDLGDAPKGCVSCVSK